jgi:hypothetical protein
VRVARAYRPFDGTDASVADVGEFALELGPVQYYRHAGARYLIAPATVLNLGLIKDVELVGDFKELIGVDRVPGEARYRTLDAHLLGKFVLRRGSLQGEGGVSLALETGALLPEVHGEDRFGFQANLIASYRWQYLTVHLDEEAELARSGGPAVFSGVIVEGPQAWPIRPVAELFAERERDVPAGYSALLGAIWPADEKIVLDGGFRAAREDGARATEVRLGFTWVQGLWTP